MRRYFRMMAFEYSPFPPTPLASTNWEHPNLTSVLVVRHPMSRLLANDAWTAGDYPDIARGNASNETWWNFAINSVNTDNFALRVLSGSGCCLPTPNITAAEELIARFTVVLDIDCLYTGMQALADLLGFEHEISPNTWAPMTKPIAPEDRIPSDVYEYLLEKNRLDIDLYEWAKQKSLVDCAAVPPTAFHSRPPETLP